MADGNFILGDGSGGGGGGEGYGVSTKVASGGAGGGTDDLLNGTSGDDIIFGDGSGGGMGGFANHQNLPLSATPGLAGGGADIIYGGSGNDILFGDGFNGGGPPIQRESDGSTTYGNGSAGAGGFGGGGGGGGVVTGFTVTAGDAGLFAGSGGSLANAGGDAADVTAGGNGFSYRSTKSAGGGGGFGTGGGAGGNGTDYDTLTYAQDGGAGGDTGGSVADTGGVTHAFVSNEINTNAIFNTTSGTLDGVGAGNDTLDGNAGSDHYYGLGGADTFIVDIADNTGSDIDTVHDYSTTEGDMLTLRNASVDYSVSDTQNILLGNHVDVSSATSSLGVVYYQHQTQVLFTNGLTFNLTEVRNTGSSGTLYAGDSSGGGGGGAFAGGLGGPGTAGNGGDGGGGDDTINGSGGNDILLGDGDGGAGGNSDVVAGTAGNGGSGNDVLNGNDGNDLLIGDGFDGTAGTTGVNSTANPIGFGGFGGLSLAPPANDLDGGNGNDDFYTAAGLFPDGNTCCTAGSFEDDGLGGYKGTDGHAGGTTTEIRNDTVMDGSATFQGNDVTGILSLPDNNNLHFDWVNALRQKNLSIDSLTMGAGADTLNGGAGSDDYIGGGGADLFIVDIADNDGDDDDIIYDFNAAEGDKIQLQNNGQIFTEAEVESILAETEPAFTVSDNGIDTLITMSNGATLELRNTLPADLTVCDFFADTAESCSIPIPTPTSPVETGGSSSGGAIGGVLLILLLTVTLARRLFRNN